MVTAWSMKYKNANNYTQKVLDNAVLEGNIHQKGKKPSLTSYTDVKPRHKLELVLPHGRAPDTEDFLEVSAVAPFSLDIVRDTS